MSPFTKVLLPPKDIPYAIELTMSEDTPDVEVHENKDTQLPLYRQTDRDRAILTRTDRELLLNEKEYDSEQALRNARHRLREHIRNSLHDIFLIASYLDQDELKQLVDRQRELDDGGEHSRISYTAGVFKFACQLANVDVMNDQRQTFEERIEADLLTAIPAVVERTTDDIVVTDVEVNISIETEEDTDVLIDELVSGNPRMRMVMSYLERNSAERLRKELREQDEVIDLVGSEVIDPEHDIFELFVEGGSDSS